MSMKIKLSKLRELIRESFNEREFPSMDASARDDGDWAREYPGDNGEQVPEYDDSEFDVPQHIMDELEEETGFPGGEFAVRRDREPASEFDPGYTAMIATHLPTKTEYIYDERAGTWDEVGSNAGSGHDRERFGEADDHGVNCKNCGAENADDPDYPGFCSQGCATEHAAGQEDSREER